MKLYPEELNLFRQNKQCNINEYRRFKLVCTVIGFGMKKKVRGCKSEVDQRQYIWSNDLMICKIQQKWSWPNEFKLSTLYSK